MRQNKRRLVAELGKSGTLTVDNPLSLVDKTVTIVMTGVVVREADIKSAKRAADAGAEIVVDVDSIDITEVVVP